MKYVLAAALAASPAQTACPTEQDRSDLNGDAAFYPRHDHPPSTEINILRTTETTVETVTVTSASMAPIEMREATTGIVALAVSGMDVSLLVLREIRSGLLIFVSSLLSTVTSTETILVPGTATVSSTEIATVSLTDTTATTEADLVSVSTATSQTVTTTVAPAFLTTASPFKAAATEYKTVRFGL
ncbi:hypothetical protein DL771_007919 [Monosporascus sp. 5C6A]|nr:hypothetical protein DL771_007919 [Monosporascus sp. 5C6A]